MDLKNTIYISPLQRNTLRMQLNGFSTKIIYYKFNKHDVGHESLRFLKENSFQTKDHPNIKWIEIYNQ